MKKLVCFLFVLTIVSLFSGIVCADGGKQDFSKGWRFNSSIEAEQSPGFNFDDSKWKMVHLPHTWNATDAQDGGSYLRTVSWYRKELVWNNQYQGKKVFLEFLGANMQAECFVNGHGVGRHQGGYTAFRFDITNRLHKGTNVVAVKVDNRHSESIAPLAADFSFFGGIYRKVSLVVTDEVHVDRMDNGASGLYLTTRNVSEKQAILEVSALIKNESSKAQLVEIAALLKYPNSFKEIEEISSPLCDVRKMSPGGGALLETTTTISIPAGGSYKFKKEWTVNRPHLWNGRTDPFRYQVDLNVTSDQKVVDSLSDFVGFRYFSANEKGFFLNGKLYPLRGVNRHQDREGMGNAITSKEQDEDFGLIYEMGANAVRLAHYPQDPYIYDLCDRYGLVVWAEIPLIDKYGTNSDFAEVTKQQLRELIRQQYNRPSICFWGLQNEVREKYDVQMTALMRELNELAHQEDSTGRLTTHATNHAVATRWESDVMAWNVYPGWYVQDELSRRMDSYRKSTKPAAVSEYGAGGSIYQHQTNPEVEVRGMWHPEEYQSMIHQKSIIDISTRNFIWGTFLWNMFDFASDNRKEGDRHGINDKGLVTYDRKVRKDSYYAYKVNWSNEPTVHITSSRFTERSENCVPVTVYSNCESVELLVNGTSYGIKKHKEVPCGFFQWENVPLLSSSGALNRVVAKGVMSRRTYQDSLVWKTVVADKTVKRQSTQLSPVAKMPTAKLITSTYCQVDNDSRIIRIASTVENSTLETGDFIKQLTFAEGVRYELSTESYFMQTGDKLTVIDRSGKKFIYSVLYVATDSP